MRSNIIRRLTLTVWLMVIGRFQEVREQERDRGLTTTEVAVLTFVLVAVAVAIGAMLFTYASDTVTDAPKPDIPDFSE